MVDSYLAILDAAPQIINGEIFNVGFKNQSVNELALDVKKVMGEDVKITNTESNDYRSYHVSSEKIKSILGFTTKRTIREAALDLKKAFEGGKLPNSLQDEKYFNIKRMQSINLF
jgi:nucleoside-diphosphate-sugar epimerase